MIDDSPLRRYHCKKCDETYFHMMAAEQQLHCVTEDCPGLIFEAVYRFGGAMARCCNCRMCRPGQELIKKGGFIKRPITLHCTNCGTIRNWKDVRKPREK